MRYISDIKAGGPLIQPFALANNSHRVYDLLSRFTTLISFNIATLYSAAFEPLTPDLLPFDFFYGSSTAKYLVAADAEIYARIVSHGSNTVNTFSVQI